MNQNIFENLFYNLVLIFHLVFTTTTRSLDEVNKFGCFHTEKLFEFIYCRCSVNVFYTTIVVVFTSDWYGDWYK